MADIDAVYREIDGLMECIGREGDRQVALWCESIERADFRQSAANLAHYMAFRHRDLRDLQRSLMALGLSSLGRLESRVLPTLRAVRATVAALAGRPPEPRPSDAAFFAGETLLAGRTREILGTASSRRIALLVTCPAEAGDTPAFMLELARHGVEALRINCAHDTADRWERMIRHARAAEKATGHRFKIEMDLGGPKVRTGVARLPEGEGRIKKGDLLAIVPCGGLERVDITEQHFSVECTLPEALKAAEIGQRIYVDDGKLGAKVERIEPWGLVTRVTRASSKGARLKSEKGLNFPDTDLAIPALTEKDRTDLDFVAAHADAIGFSFVQSAADVKMLQDELAKRRPNDWRSMSLILKIETAKAVRNLPDIVVAAAGRQPTAIMIARGDLAVEIGFARMAEMQEEILWIGEAAQVPVIWATQVLEHLIQKGTPSRGEMTDAAMAARAECVMLNKGPYLFEALDELDGLLGRMEQHQYKKTPRLRRLRSW
jgi:pyruvate kinase